MSIENHIQLDTSTLQVVTELDFWFLIYICLKNVFTPQIYLRPKLCAIIHCHGILKNSVLFFYETLLLLPVEYYYHALCEVSDTSVKE